MTHSTNEDPDLSGWLHWATGSGEASNFIRTVADAASIADLADYALLRPALLKLKQKTSNLSG